MCTNKPRMDMEGMDGATGHAELCQSIAHRANEGKNLSDEGYSNFLIEFQNDDLSKSHEFFLKVAARKDAIQLIHLLTITPFRHIRSRVLKSRYVYKITRQDEIERFYQAIANRCCRAQMRYAIKQVRKLATRELSEYFCEQYTRDYGLETSKTYAPSFNDKLKLWIEGLHRAREEDKIDEYFKNDQKKFKQEIVNESVDVFWNIESEIPKTPNSLRWYEFAFARKPVVSAIVKGLVREGSSLNFGHILDAVDVFTWKSVFVDKPRNWNYRLSQDQRLQILRHPRFKETRNKCFDVTLIGRLNPKFRFEIMEAKYADILERKDLRAGYKISANSLFLLSLEERQAFREIYLNSVDEKNEPRFRQPWHECAEITTFAPDIQRLLKIASSVADRDDRQRILKDCHHCIDSSESLNIALIAITTRWKNETGLIRYSMIHSLTNVRKELWGDEQLVLLRIIFENEQNHRDSCCHFFNDFLATLMSRQASFDRIFHDFEFLWNSLKAKFIQGLDGRSKHKGETKLLREDQVTNLYLFLEDQIMPEILKADSPSEFQKFFYSSSLIELSNLLLHAKCAELLERFLPLQSKLQSFSGHPTEVDLLKLYHDLGLKVDLPYSKHATEDLKLLNLYCDLGLEIDVPYSQLLEKFFNTAERGYSSCLNSQIVSSLSYPSTNFKSHLKRIIRDDRGKSNLKGQVSSARTSSGWRRWSLEFQQWYIDNVSTSVRDCCSMTAFTIDTFEDQIVKEISRNIRAETSRFVQHPEAAEKNLRLAALYDIPTIPDQRGFEPLLRREILTDSANQVIPVYIKLLKDNPTEEVLSSVEQLLEYPVGISVNKQLIRLLAVVLPVPVFLSFVVRYSKRIKHRDVKDTVLSELSLLSDRGIQVATVYEAWEAVFSIQVEGWSWRDKYSASMAEALENEQRQSYIRLFAKLYLDEDILYTIEPGHIIWPSKNLINRYIELLPADMMEAVNKRALELLSPSCWNLKQYIACLELVELYAREPNTDEKWISDYCHLLDKIYPSAPLSDYKKQNERSSCFQRQVQQIIGVVVPRNDRCKFLRCVQFLSAVDEMLWSPRPHLSLLSYFDIKKNLAILHASLKTSLDKEFLQEYLNVRTRLFNLLVIGQHDKDYFDMVFFGFFPYATLNPFIVSRVLGKSVDLSSILAALPESEVIFRAHILCYVVMSKKGEPKEEDKKIYEQAYSVLEKEIEKYGWRVTSVVMRHGLL